MNYLSIYCTIMKKVTILNFIAKENYLLTFILILKPRISSLTKIKSTHLNVAKIFGLFLITKYLQYCLDLIFNVEKL